MWALSWWSAQFGQFLVCCFSTHGALPRPKPFVKVGGTCPRVLWSRRRWWRHLSLSDINRFCYSLTYLLAKHTGESASVGDWWQMLQTLVLLTSVLVVPTEGSCDFDHRRRYESRPCSGWSVHEDISDGDASFALMTGHRVTADNFTRLLLPLTDHSEQTETGATTTDDNVASFTVNSVKSEF